MPSAAQPGFGHRGLHYADLDDADVIDMQLMKSVLERNTKEAKTALESGANVDGVVKSGVPLPFTPIVCAIVAEHPAMVSLLLEYGADPDWPVSATTHEPCPANAMSGERALHIAARFGNVEIIQLLLERSGADLEATDEAGYTPLMAACGGETCAEVVRLLLEAGADPTLKEECGLNPLRVLAANGRSPEVVDMLYAKAPATLNGCVGKGQTPLTAACGGGHESMVSKLLSLGATQQPQDGSDIYPLVVAAGNGSVGVVRILIGEGGTRAVGGGAVVANALYNAARNGWATTLRLVLTIDGEKRRSEWANSNIEGSYLLHYGAGFCWPAVVSTLLEAGATAAVHDSEGRIPDDVIGHDLRQNEVQMYRGEKIAVRRMLQRGPAYRARSWAWPSDEVDAGGKGDCDTAAAAAAAIASSPPAAKTAPVMSVRIFRPNDKTSSSKFLVGLINRYCEKN